MSIEINVEPDDGSTGLEIILHPTESNSVVQLRQIQRYVQERVNGRSQRDAARAAGTTEAAIKQQGRAVQKKLVDLRADFTATADEIRELVILQWVQKALGDDEKVAMLAMNELSRIPEVGLKTAKGLNPSGVSTTLTDETRKVLETLEADDT